MGAKQRVPIKITTPSAMCYNALEPAEKARFSRFEAITRWTLARLREDAPTMDAKPSHITLDKGKAELTIRWDDGLVSRYPLAQLREACPCVQCRGGHAKMGMDFAPDDLLALSPARSYGVTALSAVGNYALQPSWDDGHNTGIYTWSYLRHLSPQQPG